MRFLLFLFFLIPYIITNQEKNCLATAEDTKLFNELINLKWIDVFIDDCTSDWTNKWLLDGKEGNVKNSSDGMELSTGSEKRNSAHDVVLWTKHSFSGDLMIDCDYTRTEDRDDSVNILYIQATGSNEEDYPENIFEWHTLREVPAMEVYYNNMNLLHISYAAFSEDGDYIRARRYRPDLKQKNVKHHITVIKKDYDLFMRISTIQMSILLKWNFQNHPEIVEGPIGLRHKAINSASYKNFVVKELR